MAENTKQLGNTNQIQFLHGTQSALDALGVGTAGKGTPGAFYFTTDSHRMYLAQADGTIVPVNDSIQKIASINNLPDIKYADSTVSTFYYCLDENVFCIGVDNGNGGWQWIQINPDTDTNTTIEDYEVTTTQSTNNVVIKNEITDSDGGTPSDSWTLIAGDKIKLTAGTKTVKIDCTAKYTLATSGTDENRGVITLTDEKSNKTNAYVRGMNGIVVGSNVNGVFVDGDALNKADITESNMSVSAAGVIATTLKTKGGNDITGTTITPIIKLGDNTNEYKFNSGTAILPVYTITEVDNKFKGLDAVRYMGTISTTAELEALQSDTTLGTSKVAIGDAYKLTASGITYKDRSGTVKNNTDLGDLLIAYTLESDASGKPIENDNGYINKNKVCWDLIPSGDETSDTTYTGEAISAGTTVSGIHGLQIKNNGGQAVAQITAQRGNNWIEITSTPEKTNNALAYNDKNALSIKHTEFDTEVITPSSDSAITQQAKTSQTITYVTGITRDKAGHITGYNTQTATLIDTDNDTDGSITTNSVTAATVTAASSLPQGATSAAKFTHTTTYTDNAGVASGDPVDMTIVSKNNNIKIDSDTSKTAAITIGLVWGTFGS